MEQKIRRDLNLGDNLRRLRGEKGLSQEKLCADCSAAAVISAEPHTQSTNPAN